MTNAELLKNLFVQRDLSKGDFSDPKLGVTGKVQSECVVYTQKIEDIPRIYTDPRIYRDERILMMTYGVTTVCLMSECDIEELVSTFLDSLCLVNTEVKDLGPDVRAFAIGKHTLTCAGPIGVHAFLNRMHSLIVFTDKYNLT